MDLNLTKADRAIDDLIEKRAHEREVANRDSRRWRASEELYARQQAEELRLEWAEHFRLRIRAAEAMRERAVERLGKLIDDAATRVASG